MIVVNFGDAGEGEQGHLNGTELRESDGGCSFVYIIIYVVCWSCLPEKRASNCNLQSCLSFLTRKFSTIKVCLTIIYL